MFDLQPECQCDSLKGVVGWLLNVLACLSKETDLLRQLNMRPYWGKGCRSKLAVSSVRRTLTPG